MSTLDKKFDEEASAACVEYAKYPLQIAYQMKTRPKTCVKWLWFAKYMPKTSRKCRKSMSNGSKIA
jgi:hypothetical protein